MLGCHTAFHSSKILCKLFGILDVRCWDVAQHPECLAVGTFEYRTSGPLEP